MNTCAKILALAATAAALAVAGCGEKGNRAFNRRLNPPSWRQRVAMAVDHDDADNRRVGINYMAPDTKCTDTGTLKLFAFILANDRAPFVRAAAVTALGTVGNTDFAPDAIAALGDASEVVRWDAARALGKLVVDEALEPLIARAANDPSTNVRIAATQSLGSYRKGRSVRTLLQLMDVGDLSVRRAAHQSMVKIYRVDLGGEPECWADAAAGDIPPALTQAQLDAQKSWWRRFREKRQQPREQGEAEQQAEEDAFQEDYEWRLEGDATPADQSFVQVVPDDGQPDGDAPQDLEAGAAE